MIEQVQSSSRHDGPSYAVAVRTRFGPLGRPKIGHSEGKTAENITDLADGPAVRIRSRVYLPSRP